MQEIKPNWANPFWCLSVSLIEITKDLVLKHIGVRDILLAFFKYCDRSIAEALFYVIYRRMWPEVRIFTRGVGVYLFAMKYTHCSTLKFIALFYSLHIVFSGGRLKTIFLYWVTIVTLGKYFSLCSPLEVFFIIVRPTYNFRA